MRRALRVLLGSLLVALASLALAVLRPLRAMGRLFNRRADPGPLDEPPPYRSLRLMLEGPGVRETLAYAEGGWQDIPPLWEILLADAEVVSHAGAACSFSARALPARTRLRRFRRVVSGHPLIHRRPDLPMYLRGIDDFLADRIERAGRADRLRLVCEVAGTGEPLSDGATLETIARDMSVGWDDIDHVPALDSHHLLDRMLFFHDFCLSFDEWYAWVWGFGLATLNHPYFRRLEDGLAVYDPAPAAVPFRRGAAGLDPRAWRRDDVVVDRPASAAVDVAPVSTWASPIRVPRVNRPHAEAARLHARTAREAAGESGGPIDGQQARLQAEAACRVGRPPAAEHLLLLAQLLLDERMGPRDALRAHAVLDELELYHRASGASDLLRAQSLRRGDLGTPDDETVRRLLVRAEASGVAPAGPELVSWLVDMAGRARRPRDAQVLRREARYYERRVADDADEAADGSTSPPTDGMSPVLA